MSLYVNGQVFTDKVTIAETFFKRLRGFMFYKEPYVKVLVIKPCNSIHTYFMGFNIDVLFLDQDMKIIRKDENLPKNKVIAPVKGAKYVLEAEAFAFKTLQLGDLVSF